MNKLFAGAAITAAAAAIAAGAYIYSGTIGTSDTYKIELRTKSKDDKQVTYYWLVDGETECNCGTLKHIARYKTKDETKKDCNGACAKAFAAPEKRCAMCGDELCRYGKSSTRKTDSGDQAECDPDKCTPWPCTVILGQDPASVAQDLEEGPDAGV